MSKKTIIILVTVLVATIASCVGYIVYRDTTRIFPNSERADVSDIQGLDHDIYVGNVSEICDVVLKGFDTTVGPTGWPWTDPVEWEVALYEDANNYYARMIFHEYMLWWSFDDPYIVCKIPKANTGDLRNDEKKRWQTLWDINYTTLRTYDYKPYMPNSIVRKINGHTVSFGKYACKYEKYFVICDQNNQW